MLAQVMPGDWLDNTNLDTQEVHFSSGFSLNCRHLLFMDATFALVFITAAFPSLISEIWLNMELNTPNTMTKR
jgi:hypothetical protein